MMSSIEVGRLQFSDVSIEITIVICINRLNYGTMSILHVNQEQIELFFIEIEQ